MVTSEREMVRRLQEDEVEARNRSTSLQPTYEDSIPPDPENDWNLED